LHLLRVKLVVQDVKAANDSLVKELTRQRQQHEKELRELKESVSHTHRGRLEDLEARETAAANLNQHLLRLQQQ
jgi:hypothetical protein